MFLPTFSRADDDTAARRQAEPTRGTTSEGAQCAPLRIRILLSLWLTMAKRTVISPLKPAAASAPAVVFLARAYSPDDVIHLHCSAAALVSCSPESDPS